MSRDVSILCVTKIALRRLCLAAIAALCAVAAMGPGSASATVLCETTPTTDKSNGETFCHEKWDVSVGGVVKATTTEHVLFTSNLFNATCKAAHTEVKVTNTAGEGLPLLGSVTALNFTECKMTNFTLSACTVEVKNIPFSGEGVATAEHNGVLQNVKGTGGNAGARIVCGGVIDCTFGAPKGMKLGVTSGNPAMITAKEQELTKEAGGFLCPGSATFHAKFEAVGDTDAFWFSDLTEEHQTATEVIVETESTEEAQETAEDGTVLCETTPTAIDDDAVCHEGWDVAAKSVVSLAAKSTLFTTNLTNVKCSSSETELETGSTGKPDEAIEVDVPSLGFAECKMTSFPFVSCGVEAVSLPYDATLAKPEGGHDGVFKNLKGKEGKNAGAKIVCSGFISCTFGFPEGMELKVKGGEPASTVFSEQELTKEAGGLCPKTSTFHATYSAQGPTDGVWFADMTEEQI